MQILPILVVVIVGLSSALVPAHAASGGPGAGARSSPGLFGEGTRALGLGMVGLGMVAWSLQRRRSRDEEWDDEPVAD
jgi:hypothetical protein